MAESFPNLTRDTNLQIQKVEQNSNRTNPKKSITRQIIIKPLKNKDKEKNLESSQGKLIPIRKKKKKLE